MSSSVSSPGSSYTALALAGSRANAIGVVRISLGPDAIAIELQQVAPFAIGFTPGAFAEPVQIHAAYTMIRGLLRQEDLLYVTFDPERVAPYNRFAFSFVDKAAGSSPHAVLVRRFRARLATRWAASALPLPIGALAAWWCPEGFATGMLARLAVGATVACGAYLALRWVLDEASLEDAASSEIRDRFEAELSSRLALSSPAFTATPARRPLPAPVAVRVPARRRAPLLGRPKTAPSPSPAASTPAVAPVAHVPARSIAPARGPMPAGVFRGLMAATAVAFAAVAAMAFYVAHDAPAREAVAAPEVPRARSGIGAAGQAIPIVLPDLPPPDRCVCTRADSPLWRDGIPRLSILTFHGEDEASAPLTPVLDRHGHPGFDFDLAVVNNGARALRDVRVTLTFARRDTKGRRVGAVDRGLFWSGVLAPGASVKWRVSAPGTELRIDASVNGTLEEAKMDPAAPDAFAKLIASHFRAVRLHAATMLARLRDRRAVNGLASGGPDSALIDAIRRAAAPVIACDVTRRAEGEVDACLFNSSTQVRRGLAVRSVRPGEPAPPVPVDVELPVHDGRRVRVTLATLPGESGELEVVDPTGD